MAFDIEPTRWGMGSDGTNAAATTAGINAALAFASMIGESHVTIGPGTYLIDAVNEARSGYDKFIGAGIRPLAGQTLTLAPGAVLKVEPNGSPGSACIYLGRGQDNITIRGGRILGDRATHDYTDQTKPTHEWGYGIVTRGAKNILIEDVSITGCAGDAIAILSEGLIGLGSYYPSENITIRRCQLDGSRRNNISVVACDGVLIESNRITNAGTDDGIHDGCAPRFGIDIEGYGEGAIDYEIPLNVTVRDNILTGNHAGAIMNYTGERVVIRGNMTDGMISYGYSTQTVITENILTDPGKTKTGIHANGAPAAGAVITGNVITGFATGIDARGAEVLITGNLVRGAGNVGIGCWTLTDATIQGNYITGAGLRGVDVRFNCARIRVVDNTSTSTPTPVRVEAGATDVTSVGTVP